MKKELTHFIIAGISTTAVFVGIIYMFIIQAQSIIR